MSVCDGYCMNMDGASSVRLFDRLPVHLVCRVLSYVPAAEALGVCSCVDTTFRSAAAAACAAVNVDFLGSLLQVSVEDVAFGMEGPVDPLQAARVAARPTLSSGFRVMQSGEGIIVHTTTMTHATAFTPHTALNLSYAVALPPAKEALLRVMGGWRHACEMGTAASSCPLIDPFVLHARQCAALEAASMALVEHGERVLSEKRARGGRMASGEEAPSSATAAVVSTPCLRRRAAAAPSRQRTAAAYRALLGSMIKRVGLHLHSLSAFDGYLDATMLANIAGSLPPGALLQLNIGCMLHHRVHSRVGSLAHVLSNAAFRGLRCLNIANADVRPAELHAVLEALPALEQLNASGVCRHGEWIFLPHTTHAHHSVTDSASHQMSSYNTSAAALTSAGAAQSHDAPSCLDDDVGARPNPMRIVTYGTVMACPSLWSYAAASSHDSFHPYDWLFSPRVRCGQHATAAGTASSLKEIVMLGVGDGILHELLPAMFRTCPHVTSVEMGYTADVVLVAGGGCQRKFALPATHPASVRLDVCPRVVLPLRAVHTGAVCALRVPVYTDEPLPAGTVPDAYTHVLDVPEERSSLGYMLRSHVNQAYHSSRQGLRATATVPEVLEVEDMTLSTALWHAALYAVASSPAAPYLRRFLLHGHVPCSDAVLMTLVQHLVSLQEVHIACCHPTEADTYFTPHPLVHFLQHEPDDECDCFSPATAQHCARIIRSRSMKGDVRSGVSLGEPGAASLESMTREGDAPPPPLLIALIPWRGHDAEAVRGAE